MGGSFTPMKPLWIINSLQYVEGFSQQVSRAGRNIDKGFVFTLLLLINLIAVDSKGVNFLKILR